MDNREEEKEEEENDKKEEDKKTWKKESSGDETRWQKGNVKERERRAGGEAEADAF